MSQTLVGIKVPKYLESCFLDRFNHKGYAETGRSKTTSTWVCKLNMKLARLLLNLILICQMQSVFAGEGPVRIGELLKKYWQDGSPTRDEIRHVFYNLGVPLKYLNGSQISHNCNVVLVSKGHLQYADVYNSTDQFVHPMTATVLNRVFHYRETLQLAMYNIAVGIASSNEGLQYSLISAQSITQLLRPRPLAQGGLIPLFFPLELYREQTQDKGNIINQMSTTLSLGMSPKFEDLITKVANAVNERIVKLLQNPNEKIYMYVHYMDCDAQSCKVYVSLLNQDSDPHQGGELVVGPTDAEMVKGLVDNLWGRALTMANGPKPREKKP